MRRRYKIGEFAKNLGVSPGFLKHHESYGLLQPYVSESGYRYYEFPHAMQAFQCLRMQGMGFTSKEISDILNRSAERDMSALFQEKTEEIRQKVAFYQEVLQYMEVTYKEEERAESTPLDDWTVEIPAPFYYLENARRGEFEGNTARYEAAEKWNQYMPIVEVGSRFAWKKEAEEPYSMEDWYMGLSISQAIGDRLGIYRNEEVRLVRLGKCLVYRYSGNKKKKTTRSLQEQLLGVPLEICRKHGFHPCGDIYLFQYFASNVGEESFIRESVVIPIQ